MAKAHRVGLHLSKCLTLFAVVSLLGPTTWTMSIRPQRQRRALKHYPSVYGPSKVSNIADEQNVWRRFITDDDEQNAWRRIISDADEEDIREFSRALKDNLDDLGMIEERLYELDRKAFQQFREGRTYDTEDSDVVEQTSVDEETYRGIIKSINDKIVREVENTPFGPKVKKSPTQAEVKRRKKAIQMRNHADEFDMDINELRKQARDDMYEKAQWGGDSELEDTLRAIREMNSHKVRRSRRNDVSILRYPTYSEEIELDFPPQEDNALYDSTVYGELSVDEKGKDLQMMKRSIIDDLLRRKKEANSKISHQKGDANAGDKHMTKDIAHRLTGEGLHIKTETPSDEHFSSVLESQDWGRRLLHDLQEEQDKRQDKKSWDIKRRALGEYETDETDIRNARNGLSVGDGKAHGDRSRDFKRKDKIPTDSYHSDPEGGALRVPGGNGPKQSKPPRKEDLRAHESPTEGDLDGANGTTVKGHIETNQGENDLEDEIKAGGRKNDKDEIIYIRDPTGDITRRPMRYDVSLDPKGHLHLYWDIDPVTETLTFRLEARVQKRDLVGFGFSDYGEPTDADVIIAWTDLSGRHLFQDAHTDANGMLHLDKRQDYMLDGVGRHGDLLTFTFHRPYDTCDDDDYMIDTGTTHIIFFTDKGQRGSVEGLNVTALTPGLQRAQLIKSQLPDPVFPKDTQTVTMHVDNVTIPGQETTYWCAIRKLPPMQDKHHIIRFESAISPESEGIVHHMEVFHCEVTPGETVRDYNAPCKTMGAERPAGLEACRNVIGAWAMGARPLAYPEEAGSPIGGPGFSSYVMMEVHYNNPTLRTGVIDSSGIKFYYTKTLRKHDAGIMELGLEYNDKHALPPGLPLWALKGYCIPQCTQVALPEEGIKVFASQLHTHLTGRRAYTKHYRHGVEMPDLNRDNHYSPHYQEIRKLPRPVTVLPSDSLVMVCEDRTVDKKNLTLSGFSISDEMCVNYIHYYPKVDLEVCKSSVTTESLYGFFRFLHEYQGESTSTDLGISDNFKAIKWLPINVDLLKTYYEMAPLSMQCNQSDGSRFPGVNWEGQPIPKVLFPMPPEERPCLL